MQYLNLQEQLHKDIKAQALIPKATQNFVYSKLQKRLIGSR